MSTYPESRPLCWGECFGMPRPCPFVSCKFHLFLDVRKGGKIKINPQVKDVEDLGEALRALPETCALDVANANPDGVTLETVGRLFGITRERVRQIEVVASNRFWLALSRFLESEGITWEDL